MSRSAQCSDRKEFEDQNFKDDPALKLKVQKERKLAAETRKVNQSKRRDKQDLAAVADQSVSEDDAEVNVAGRWSA